MRWKQKIVARRSLQQALQPSPQVRLRLHRQLRIRHHLESVDCAGIDVELPIRKCYSDPLKTALEAGEIGMEFVDTAASRHLQKKFELGLFEHPYVDEGRVLEVFETSISKPNEEAKTSQRFAFKDNE